MRKENAAFRTAFLSEEGSQLQNRDYFAYVELDSFACYVAADSLDAEREKNSARTVVECILREFMEHPSLSAASIRKNLHKAHKELLTDKDGLRLRASVSMVVTNYVKFRYANVGNARVALLRNGRILYESHDQSLTENLVEQEEVPKDKAALHEERNNLYSYLGQIQGQPKLQVTRKQKLVNGDILLLYTRGVWENCDDTELLEAATEASAPQDVADSVEDLILGKQKAEIDNYTVSVTFVDKVYLNPKKRWTAKKILAVVLPVAAVLLILGIVLFVRYRIREGNRADMEQYLESAAKYVSYDDYEKAAEEYGQAKALAKKLKLTDKQEEIQNAILLAEQIQRADRSLEEGEYEEAQELFLEAGKLSVKAGGAGKEYIAGRQEKTGDYLELYELLETGETKEGYGDYAGAIEAYGKAKKKASSLYDKEGRGEALEKQRSAEEALEEMRQEELAKLEEKIQKAVEEEQVAQELLDQGLMNDKNNALELESKGNELMNNEDYLSAVTYFETAMGMYQDLGMTARAQTLTTQIEACKKLQEEAKKKAEEEAAKQAAENAAAAEAQNAAEDARKAVQELKDAEKDKALEDTKKALEDAQKAAEEAKKAAEDAKKAAEENKKDEEETESVPGGDVSGNDADGDSPAG